MTCIKRELKVLSPDAHFSTTTHVSRYSSRNGVIVIGSYWVLLLLGVTNNRSAILYRTSQRIRVHQPQTKKHEPSTLPLTAYSVPRQHAPLPTRHDYLNAKMKHTLQSSVMPWTKFCKDFIFNERGRQTMRHDPRSPHPLDLHIP